MKLLLTLLVFLHPLFPGVVAGESQSRKLPADLQVDLIFPHANETYAPTQWFPVIFGVTNLEAVWPLYLYVDIEIFSMAWRINDTGSSSWQDVAPRINRALLQQTFKTDTPGRHFSHTPLVNMTNGTTDQFAIRWALVLRPRCFDNNSTVDERGWSNGPAGGGNRVVRFDTAPGAESPDIEAALSDCREPDEENSVAVRVTDVKNPSGLLDADGRQQMCPVFQTGIETDGCAYKQFARELAANVSTKMLGEMGCEDGVWQDITAPCPKKESIASSRRLKTGIQRALLALVLTTYLA
ncbi:hypothetical protein CkaCkLH20_03673 [Colletotrichum karsti]|uniref:DUF7136 domain-containing protein n=1 Tax=Colletotrichum karsti TaxID=1095194 RepID=A0A9P6LMF5_9PEZI|nr:uncharacterized protein CkaCkLH20_03673 [Colletotrichum karsti]KAF9878773.1 hypothetical protein CkaCkLH20_03673 [Colletotrichum karsti]